MNNPELRRVLDISAPTNTQDLTVKTQPDFNSMWGATPNGISAHLNDTYFKIEEILRHISGWNGVHSDSVTDISPQLGDDEVVADSYNLSDIRQMDMFIDVPAPIDYITLEVLINEFNNCEMEPEPSEQSLALSNAVKF